MSEVNRLRWKCRRGMLELDLILNRFLEREYEQLAPDQRHAFNQLLETADEELWSLISDTQQDTAPALNLLLSKLRAC